LAVEADLIRFATRKVKSLPKLVIPVLQERID